MIIGVTERENYKRCRRRWHLSSRSRENLEKLIPHTASLPIGTLVHDALGKWLEQPNVDVANLYWQSALDFNRKLGERYRDAVGAAPSASEMQGLHEQMVMGRSMMENYQTRYGTPLPPDFEVVSPEQRVRVAIPGTLHDTEWVWAPADKDGTIHFTVSPVGPDSLETVYMPYGCSQRIRLPQPDYHYLEGRLDAIVRDSKRVKLYVLEHKTYGNRPKLNVLHSNDQFLAYHWMLMRLNIGEPGGVLYDGLWKRAAPPDKVDGRAGTLQDLFCRERIERPPHELEEFEQNLAAEANEMASNPPLYINRTWDGSCEWGCAMNILCRTMSRGEDVDYIRQTMYTQRPSDDEAEQEEAA